IPLADQSVDAVFVGDAFHWFDAQKALAEIRRVAAGLAVTGHLWGIKAPAALVPPSFRDDLDAGWRRFHGATMSSEFHDWRDVCQSQGPVASETTVRISGRDLVDLPLTASTTASIPDDERAAIAARAYPLMEGEYDMRVLTELYWLRF